jgi:uncharacterized protein
MAVVIKTFTTPRQGLCFHRETNALLLVSRDEYPAFQRIESNTATDDDWSQLKRYVEQGYLKESNIKEIVHPASPYLRHQMENHMQQITLQCTQACNLMCSYCVYGGSYENQRTHSDKTMPLETMKKAIDFGFARARRTEQFAIGFYGGEPLLAIDNIKVCVAYIHEKYPGRKVLLTLTTNGTLFTDDIIQFLHENDFAVSISLDGPKDLHDMNRVYADGSGGSFDDIFNRLAYIKEQYPEFYRKLSFMTTVAPGVDFSCVNEFYNVSDVLEDNATRHNLVNQYGIKEDSQYGDLYSVTGSYQHMKALLAAVGLYDKEKLSKLYTSSLTDVQTAYKALSKRNIGEKVHPGGPCLPGVMRTFVSTDGTLYPCERVNECKSTKIGHVDTGFDMDRSQAILNVGKLTESECRNCWCFTSCGLCVAACDGGDELSRDERLKHCTRTQYTALETLRTICLLLENGYNFEKKDA